MCEDLLAAYLLTGDLSEKPGSVKMPEGPVCNKNSCTPYLRTVPRFCFPDREKGPCFLTVAYLSEKSGRLRCLNIMLVLKRVARGLATPLPAMSFPTCRAPCSKMATFEPTLAPANEHKCVEIRQHLYLPTNLRSILPYPGAPRLITQDIPALESVSLSQQCSIADSHNVQCVCVCRRCHKRGSVSGICGHHP